MNSFIIKSGSKKLNGFYPNGLNDVFAFKTKSWYSFSTESEALDFIKHIREEINNPDNLSRYGEKFSKKYKSIAKNLYVAEVK